MVLLPVSAVTGFTTTEAAVPTPAVVLQVSVMGDVAVSRLVAFMVPMEAARVSREIETFER
jgi:hypothetical protein